MADNSEKTPGKIGYARVSTADQNLEMQIEALKRYGVSDEFIFTDKMSGAKRDRPGLTRALKVAQHEGTELVVWKLDRLGRSLLGIIQTVQMLAERGVRLVSLTEGLDLGTPMGRMIVHIMGALAEYERELIRERTMAGLEQARREGKAHGRPVAMTPERTDLAGKMLDEGAHILKDVLPALQALEGPKVSRSALYAWVKEYRALVDPDEATDDR
ncbi:recombinase family protein [Defluviimonas aestuarii]|uniref:recombinase family protein n=1 Tax=Albidovulum aestuarii TaxID=1130726 RepID=UPI00249AA1C1|nr:recombinase family protein [Defluviimonas aestuarii]MDI3335845.1 recombinase family protein [Defluviimonas aestuarii]